MKIITYATHSEGLFDELINNKYNIPIIVLGYGDKWNGFMDKLKKVYNYIKKLEDNEIIICIDGFDTYINQPENIIKERFLNLNSDIVLSKDSELVGNYTTKKIFGTCKDNLIANGGLYMGYNKDIKKLLKHIIETNYSNDDQVNLNKACSNFDNIKIDKEKKLFHNLDYYERYFNNKSDSCFVSIPGALNWNRLKRVPEEYFQFIWKEILLLILLILVCYYYYNYK